MGVTDARLKTDLLPAEQGPRVLFGKAYHWELHGGRLSLQPGIGAALSKLVKQEGSKLVLSPDVTETFEALEAIDADELAREALEDYEREQIEERDT
jgi:hypothetical protein